MTRSCSSSVRALLGSGVWIAWVGIERKRGGGVVDEGVGNGEGVVVVLGDGDEGLGVGEEPFAPFGGQDNGCGAPGSVRFSEGLASNNCHFPVTLPVTSVILPSNGLTVKGGGGGGIGPPCW